MIRQKLMTIVVLDHSGHPTPAPSGACEPIMKKCRRCAKTATLHITEVREGHGTVVHLCETCAREYLNNGGPSASDGESDLASKLDELIAESSESPSVCPNCGIAFNEFREHGRFGCPHDYTAFHDELVPLLENIHEDTKHSGKKPRSMLIGTADQGRLVQLRSDQQKAIEAEDYESAARLRDDISALELAVRTEPAVKPRRKRKTPETPAE